MGAKQSASSGGRGGKGRGPGISRHFTTPHRSPFDDIDWREFAGAEAPAAWSDTAIEIAAGQYFRRETSVRQLIHRVTRTLRLAGEWQGYFESGGGTGSGAAARIFEDELSFILLHQLASFNSPVYYNVGLFPSYGYLGTGENFAYDRDADGVRPLSSAYLRPQASACFIQDVQDDLLSIFDLLKSEAKLFKYGSGTGTNFSHLRARGEPLEMGGVSTGLISYLEVFDKAAQAIKSGGTNRRAAKMVVLDADHPEILEFIRWKRDEERKARVLINSGFSGGMEGEAYRTVSGQNSNNSVRVTDEFLRRVASGEMWPLRARVDGKVVREIEARKVWREMARAAWECADPGVQYHDQVQRWHLCPRSGEIRASNPCSEYMFLDNSACNLASLNLARFLRDERGRGASDGSDESAVGFDWTGFKQCVRVMLLAQDILVDYASYPTESIAANSHAFRPLGLGYANLGGLLMRLGIAYESEAAERWTSRVTGAMHALALETSQKLAEAYGAFSGWKENRESALRVLENHLSAWKEREIEDLPWVEEAFVTAIKGAERTGLRNAQVTLVAPTGTIGLFMDCDTLGIEPDFSLIKRKTLAAGGELRLVNQSVEPALRRLGYASGERKDILRHLLVQGTVLGAAGLKPEHMAVFDGAMPPAGFPERCVSPLGHLKIMAAAQPFLSGAISKTVNLPTRTTVEDVERIFREGWRLGLKSIAIYRDGSKSLQPLCTEC